MNRLFQIIKNKIKHIVLAIFCLLFFAPMVQKQFSIIKERKLEGNFETAQYPAFTFAAFKSGEFQEQFEIANSSTIGFYETLIHLHAQMNYSLFNISKMQDVVVGKEGNIYINSYIKAVNGEDFRRKEAIDIVIQKALLVQKELKKKNVDLVFAFAPGKGSFYPEYLPEELIKNANPDSTNYSYYIDVLGKTTLNAIDIRKYFLSIKDTSKNILFAKTGVHWSEYASVLAMDTISNYISNLRKIKLRPFEISNFERRMPIKWGDYDAAHLMNLFSWIQHEELPYVTIKYPIDSACVKPKLLTVADSYFNCIIETNIVDSLFSDWDYWIYNRHKIKSGEQKDSTLRSELEKRDVILLLATDATLGLFPYGFLDEAYEAYAPKNKDYYKLKDKEFRIFVYETFDNIKKNKVWRNQLIQAAKEKGITETEQFFEAAVWCYKNK